METNPVKLNKEARALRDKMPFLHSALTCTNTFRRAVALEVCVCAFEYIWEQRLCRGGRFQLSAYRLVFGWYFFSLPLPQLHILQTLTHHYFWPEKQPIVFTPRSSASITL